ncbi:MAG: glycosyltransferase [Rhodoblastus sp.]
MSGLLDILRWIAAVYCGLALFGIALTVTLGLVAPLIHARRARRADLPPISFVLPIKDWAPGFRPSQGSVFELDYPVFDVTATAAEEESRAVSAMRSVIEAYPGHEAKIVRSTASFAVSPKVNNLFQAIEDAKYDLIATKDSNIELPPQTARAAVAAMTEGVGLVTAITEAKGARNLAARIEASLMNQSHARILHAAAALGLGFGLGKLMIFKRSDLHRAGGFDAIAHTVGEDFGDGARACRHRPAHCHHRRADLSDARRPQVFRRLQPADALGGHPTPERAAGLSCRTAQPVDLRRAGGGLRRAAGRLERASRFPCGACVLVRLRNRACLGAGLGCIGERPRRHGRARRDDGVCLAARMVHQARRLGGRSL